MEGQHEEGERGETSGEVRWVRATTETATSFQGPARASAPVRSSRASRGPPRPASLVPPVPPPLARPRCPHPPQRRPVTHPRPHPSAPASARPHHGRSCGPVIGAGANVTRVCISSFPSVQICFLLSHSAAHVPPLRPRPRQRRPRARPHLEALYLAPRRPHLCLPRQWRHISRRKNYQCRSLSLRLPGARRFCG